MVRTLHRGSRYAQRPRGSRSIRFLSRQAFDEEQVSQERPIGKHETLAVRRRGELSASSPHGDYATEVRGDKIGDPLAFPRDYVKAVNTKGKSFGFAEVEHLSVIDP